MITSKEKITTPTIKVRFHWWKDPNFGWGDDGTVCYKEIPIEYFMEKKINNGFSYRLKRLPIEELGLENYWWMDMGYHLTSKRDIEDEIKELEVELQKSLDGLKMFENE